MVDRDASGFQGYKQLHHFTAPVKAVDLGPGNALVSMPLPDATATARLWDRFDASGSQMLPHREVEAAALFLCGPQPRSNPAPPASSGCRVVFLLKNCAWAPHESPLSSGGPSWRRSSRSLWRSGRRTPTQTECCR